MEHGEFKKRYSEALETVLLDIKASGARHVVALARKGPRLIDMCLRGPLQPHIRNLTVLTDRSLWFLPPNYFDGQVVPVLDDIATYGSTLKYVCDLVVACGGKPVPYALAINKHQLNTELTKPRYALGLSFKQSSTFNNALVDAIGRLAKPFDVDYPIGEAPCNQSPSELIEKLVGVGVAPSAIWARREASEQIRCISVDLASYSTTPPFLRGPGIRSIGITKLRFYFEPSVVRVVPMCLFEWAPSVSALTVPSASSVDPYHELFESLNTELFINPDPGLDGSSYRLYQLGFYLSGLYLLGKAWTQLGLDTVLGLTFDDITWQLQDIAYVFGPHVGNQILHRIPALFSFACRDATIDPHPRPVLSSSQARNRLIANSLTAELGTALDVMPINHRSTADILGDLLNITYIKHEREERSRSVHRPRRLCVGFTASEIGVLLADKGTLSDYGLSEAIDRLIDAGAAVPQITRLRTEQDEAQPWVRVYRYGENGFGTPTQKTEYFLAYVVEALHDLIPRYSKRRKWVSEYMLDKALASLLLSPLRHEQDLKELGLHRIVDEFGARVFIEAGPHRVPMLEYGVNIGLFDVVRKANRKEIRVSSAWRERHPPQNSALDERHTLSDITSFFHCFLAFIANEDKGTLVSNVSGERILALSTCGKQEHAIEAIKVEAALWFQHPRYNVEHLLAKWFSCLPGQDNLGETLDDSLVEIARTLEALATYTRQSEDKAQVFRAVRIGLAKQMEALFVGDKAPHFSLEPPYRKSVSPLLNGDVSPQNQRALSMLYRFGRVLRSFTNYLRSMFAVTNVTRAVERSNAEDISRRWLHFRESMADFLERFPEVRTISLPESPTAAGSEAATPFTRLSYDRVSVIVRALRSIYDAHIESISAAKIKEPVENEIVAIYDLASSSNFQLKDRGAILASLESALSRLREQNEPLQFSRSTNDGNVVRFRNVQTALRTVHALRAVAVREGAALIVSLCSTKETSQFFEIDADHPTWSTAIPVCARIEQAVKQELATSATRSICIVTEYVKELATDAGITNSHGHFIAKGRLDPRGQTLPPVSLYELAFPEEHAESLLE